jgi:hypothetical protein
LKIKTLPIDTAFNDRDCQMSVARKDQNQELIPMAIASLITLACVAALLLLDFRPNNSQGNADGMITAAVVSRAGATATPSEKPTGIAAPATIVASERPGH